ncbi:MAG: PKD domain-containing protein [Weeksellaceae bacterium]|nr:PKD domain-containing protein [Weeksellaceae bacterium]
MKYLLHFTLVLFVSVFTFAQETKQVLFLGNSYTQAHNLPVLVSEMAASTGDELIFDSHTPGGFRFMNHVSNATSLSKISDRDWDFVVLQEQSQLPSFPLPQVQQNVFPYAEQLTELIRANNPCTIPVFFNTWGRKNGDQQNCPNFPTLCTYEGMDDLLQERYRTMAEDNFALIAPVAAVWRHIRANHPDFELYTSDGSHPSLLGSMAAAYTFYTIIFQKNPQNVSYTQSLTDQQAQILKNTVHDVVFQHLEQWFIGEHDNFAHFTTTFHETSGIQFNPSFPFSNNFTWDFGDGNSSHQLQPIHQFSAEGTYLVTLTVNTCDDTFTYTIPVQVSNLATQESPISAIKVYPNPAKDILYIDQVNANYIRIVDSAGKVVHAAFSTQSGNTLVHCAHLPAGLYHLIMVEGDKRHRVSFLKK